MFLLDVDPRFVSSGWAPLLLTLLLGVIIVFLWLSMRKQMRRIDLPEDRPAESGWSADEPKGVRR